MKNVKTFFPKTSFFQSSFLNRVWNQRTPTKEQDTSFLLQRWIFLWSSVDQTPVSTLQTRSRVLYNSDWCKTKGECVERCSRLISVFICVTTPRMLPCSSLTYVPLQTQTRKVIVIVGYKRPSQNMVGVEKGVRIISRVIQPQTTRSKLFHWYH